MLLAVQPEGHLAYGGRHITIASATASSAAAVAAAAKKCDSHLKGGWSMKGAPANCLGHMDAGKTVCKDNHRWDLKAK
jgi:hypothetical protein